MKPKFHFIAENEFLLHTRTFYTAFSQKVSQYKTSDHDSDLQQVLTQFHRMPKAYTEHWWYIRWGPHYFVPKTAFPSTLQSEWRLKQLAPQKRK